ncbi:Protein of unknown function [Gryllus bimaculatus]|nr:Protein of unknown function [Gryllus bimaculatus]
MGERAGEGNNGGKVIMDAEDKRKDRWGSMSDDGEDKRKDGWGRMRRKNAKREVSKVQRREGKGKRGWSGREAERRDETRPSGSGAGVGRVRGRGVGGVTWPSGAARRVGCVATRCPRGVRRCAALGGAGGAGGAGGVHCGCWRTNDIFQVYFKRKSQEGCNRELEARATRPQHATQHASLARASRPATRSRHPVPAHPVPPPDRPARAAALPCRSNPLGSARSRQSVLPCLPLPSLLPPAALVPPHAPPKPACPLPAMPACSSLRLPAPPHHPSRSLMLCPPRRPRPARHRPSVTLRLPRCRRALPSRSGRDGERDARARRDGVAISPGQPWGARRWAEALTGARADRKPGLAPAPEAPLSTPCDAWRQCKDDDDDDDDDVGGCALVILQLLRALEGLIPAQKASN